MYKILINHTPECLCDIVERCLLVSQYFPYAIITCFTFQLRELLHAIIVLNHQQLSYGTLCQTV